MNAPYENLGVILEDYSHSANSLFNFVDKEEYLLDALKQRAFYPRYCKEDIRYLRLANKDTQYDEIAVPAKCFCDIKLSNITWKRSTHNWKGSVQSESAEIFYSHTKTYGGYALGFSKTWGEKVRLQPVHYINEQSSLATYIKDALLQSLTGQSVDNAMVNPQFCTRIKS